MPLRARVSFAAPTAPARSVTAPSANKGSHIKAIAVARSAGPVTFEMLEVDEPHAGADEVRIRVAVAAIDLSDAAVRPPSYGPGFEPSGPAYRYAWDTAGTVDEVGDGADWSVGDEVMAIVVPRGAHVGTYAEHVVVPIGSLARIPAGSSFVAASTLPRHGLAARESLDRLDLRPGQTLAVTGAAEGYGAYVVQLAKADGLWVIADAARADEKLVTSLGADMIVPSGDDFAERVRSRMPGGVDAVADGAGMGPKVVPAIYDGGGIAVMYRWKGPAERGVVVHQINVHNFAGNQSRLDWLRQQVEDGALALRTLVTLAAEDAVAPHRQFEWAGLRGRVLVEFSRSSSSGQPMLTTEGTA